MVADLDEEISQALTEALKKSEVVVLTGGLGPTSDDRTREVVAATLGIATFAYLPYCFFNLTNVVVSFTYALLGIQIRHVEPEGELAPAPEEATLYGVGNRSVEPPPPEHARPG